MSSKTKPPLRLRGMYVLAIQRFIDFYLWRKLVFEYGWMWFCEVGVHMHELRSEIDAYALDTGFKASSQKVIHVDARWHTYIRRLAKTCVRIWQVSAAKLTAHSAVMFFAPASAIDGQCEAAFVPHRLKHVYQLRVDGIQPAAALACKFTFLKVLGHINAPNSQYSAWKPALPAKMSTSESSHAVSVMP